MNESANQEGRKIESEGPHAQLLAQPLMRSGITYSLIAVCVAIYAYLNLSQESSLSRQITEFLLPSGVIIWSGAYWGLLTTAFVHYDFWHILFNMWWFKDFGTFLEPTMGRSRYLTFIIVAALISSGAELAVTSQTGIGFSGVVYAMFGYLLAARHAEPLYQRIITKQTIVWLLGWLILCIVLTYAEVWRIANAAHIAGFLFGYSVGNAFTARVRVVLHKFTLAALVVLAILSAVYMPWSETWRDRDAIAEIIAVGDAAGDGDPDAQYRYASILTQYGEKSEAISWLKKSAGKGHRDAMNDLAWTLATDQDDTLRDGAEAVKLAESACQKDQWQTPQSVDTLAAAYAEVERWDDAVQTQQLAITRLAGADEETKKGFESRLQKYRRHEKVRE